MHNAHLRTKPYPAFFTAGQLLLLLCLLLGSAVGAQAQTPSVAAAEHVAARYLVVENVGQFAPEVRFVLTNGARRIWLTTDAIWLTVPDPAAADARSPRRWQGNLQQPVPRTGAALRFTFPGAAAPAALEPFGRVASRVSYLIGDDPARWQAAVPAWSGVRYRDLYPGVDLVIGGDAVGGVPWRFEARSAVALPQVSLKVEGAAAVTAGAGQLRLALPRHTVDIGLPVWSLPERAGPAASAVAPQADAGAFVITPDLRQQPAHATSADSAEIAAAGDLIYSSFLGGGGLDGGYGSATDYLGNVYVTGETASTNFPLVVGSYDLTYNNATDAFVAKFNAAGTALIYATYLGGSGLDLGGGIAVNGGLAFVTGETWSTDFPGAPGAAGQNDIFVASLNAAGSALRYAARLGGTGFDRSAGIAVDRTDAYVVGSTTSADLPGATGCAANGASDMVVARFDAAGSRVYASCVGGSDLDAGYAIAVRNEVAYVAGESWSNDIFPGVPLAGDNDMLVAALLGDGTLSDITLVGGTLGDWASGLAASVDDDGNGDLYLAGGTYSADFPLATGPGPAADESDAAIVRVALLNFQPDFATYLGGSSDDAAYAIAVDTVRGLYVAGATASNDFPVTSGVYDTSQNGDMDAFVARLQLVGAPNPVTYATYLGGTREDGAYSAATDTGGHAFISGATTSPNFPTTGGPARGGDYDAFMAKLKVSSPPAAPVVTIGVNGDNVGLSWGAVAAASKYQVFRSSFPYFVPGDWSSAAPLDEPTAGAYPDPGVLAQVNAYFYVVKAVSAPPAAASANSNRVGKFTFALAPGSN